MEGGVENKVEFELPFQSVQNGAGIGNFQVQRWIGDYIVGNFVGEGIPVPGRGFRLRAICPKLGDAASVVSVENDIVRVGYSGCRVSRMAGAVILSERVVAAG